MQGLSTGAGFWAPQLPGYEGGSGSLLSSRSIWLAEVLSVELHLLVSEEMQYTGLTATPEQAQVVHAVLRAQLQAATAHADRVSILYGGSMNAANAASLLAQPDVDGGLIGGASLKAPDFLSMLKAASR